MRCLGPIRGGYQSSRRRAAQEPATLDRAHCAELTLVDGVVRVALLFGVPRARAEEDHRPNPPLHDKAWGQALVPTPPRREMRSARPFGSTGRGAGRRAVVERDEDDPPY